MSIVASAAWIGSATGALLHSDSSGSGSEFGILLLAILVIAIGLYFLPTTIAVNRKHSNAGAIFVLNLLAGWTFLGWVLSLVWASTADTAKAAAPPVERKPVSHKKCPYCAEQILMEAIVCKHCHRDLATAGPAEMKQTLN